MNVEKNIEKWYEDARFLHFAGQRIREEVCNVPENHRYSAEYERLEEGFDNDDRYASPLAAYLTYRLQTAKLQRNAKKRGRGIWWVVTQVVMLGFYVNVFAEEFGPLVTEMQETLLPMLHAEYTQKMNEKKQ